MRREDAHTDIPSIISGVFGEDLGEDYFGFKSIGLDREYNIDTLNVS